MQKESSNNQNSQHKGNQVENVDKSSNIYQITYGNQIITVEPLNKVEHRHTVVWIHGLNQNENHHLNSLIQSFSDHLKYLKIVLPRAPVRYVTLMNKEVTSWFDIKFRGKKSFQVDFDEAFNSAQVKDSYQRILKPIIQKQKTILRGIQEKSNSEQKSKNFLIIGGFSQGCGMSLHSLYERPNQIDAVVGVSGYLFPISKFDKQLTTFKRIIYGLADNLRPWQFTKMTYQGKIPQNQIVLIEGMKHEINDDTKRQLKRFMKDFLHPQQIQSKNEQQKNSPPIQKL